MSTDTMERPCSGCVYDGEPDDEIICASCYGQNWVKKEDTTTESCTQFNSGAIREKEGGNGRWDLLPMNALEGVAQVLAKGGKKYGERNWEKGIPLKNYYSHALRHLAIWILKKRGSNDFFYSRSSDERHLYHAICNLMMLAETEHKIVHGELPEELGDFK